VLAAPDDPRPEAIVRLRARRPRGGVRSLEILHRRHRRLAGRPADLAVADLRLLARELGLAPGGTRKDDLVAALEGWLAGRPPEEFEDYWRPPTRPEAERLPAFTRFTAAAAQNPRQTVQELVQREARRLLATDAYAARLDEMNRTLEVELAARLRRLRDAMLAHCPDLGAVAVRASFDFTRPALAVDVELEQAGTVVGIDKVGEGRRRRLTLALHEASLAAMADEPPATGEILAYDEPDTHLDYRAQRQLFDLLQAQARLASVQVLVATHSVKFIDRAPPESLRHFRLDEGRRTTVHTLVGDAHAAELDFRAGICESLGLSNSLLLDERLFLIVEGATEAAALPYLFRQVTSCRLSEAGITLVNATGVGAMRQLLDFFVHQWRKQVVLLIDADARHDRKYGPAELERLGLVEGRSIFFIGEREFEDAFADDRWLAALAEFPPKDGDGAWTAAEIARQRGEGKFSDNLERWISRRCRDHIGKPALGDALARMCGPDDIPADLRACCRRLLHLATIELASPATPPVDRLPNSARSG
jgi:energy-coupling factor transporter ATP-binding protein EcfA2